MPKPAPAFPPPLYFILSTEQRDSLRCWTRARADGANSCPSVHPLCVVFFVLFVFSLSPDSVQLPVVSVMKEVVVGGSGGARDEQRRNV